MTTKAQINTEIQAPQTILVEDAGLYKVHIGPLDSRGTADQVSQRLASLGFTQSLVVEE